jgi:hypothetical protein
VALSPSLSRKGKPLKGAKNKPGVLQRYVTYDTLGGRRIFIRCIFAFETRKALQ